MHLFKTAQLSRSLALSFTALSLAALVPSAAHAQTQDLYVTNYYSNTISHFAGTGPGKLAKTPTILSDPSLNNAESLALDAKGDLFAANYFANTITKFAAGPTPGTFGAVTTITDPSLVFTTDLGFDSHGDLFATKYYGSGKGDITEFTAGATPGTFGATSILTDPSLFNPVSLAFDANNDLFVGNTRGEITKFSAGATPGTFGATSVLTDPNITGTGIGAIAIDKYGDLVALDDTNSITEFAAGATPGTFGAISKFTAPNLIIPTSLAFDAQGNLFVGNENDQTNGGGTLTEFASTGAGTFAPGTVVETGLYNPLGLAFGPSVPAVPEASTTVSFSLLLALGLGGLVVAGKRRKA